MRSDIVNMADEPQMTTCRYSPFSRDHLLAVNAQSLTIHKIHRFVARCRGRLRDHENGADVPALGKETKREAGNANMRISKNSVMAEKRRKRDKSRADDNTKDALSTKKDAGSEVGARRITGQFQVGRVASTIRTAPRST